MMNVDDPESDLSALGGGASSSSRARMLAQQRELQLKKRQSTLQSGGIVVALPSSSFYKILFNHSAISIYQAWFAVPLTVLEETT